MTQDTIVPSVCYPRHRDKGHTLDILSSWFLKYFLLVQSFLWFWVFVRSEEKGPTKELPLMRKRHFKMLKRIQYIHSSANCSLKSIHCGLRFIFLLSFIVTCKWPWPEEAPLDGWSIDDHRIFLVVSCVGCDGHNRVNTCKSDTYIQYTLNSQ